MRFGVPFIGSRALVGSPVMDEPVLAAIRAFGLDPARIPDAVLDPEVKAYLEFHIEQDRCWKISTCRSAWWRQSPGSAVGMCVLRGKANHAGTTPMNSRRDALACAAEWIGLVEHLGLTTPDLVATVGKIEAQPDAGNVIPGVAIAALDVRHAFDEVRQRALNVPARRCGPHRSPAGTVGLGGAALGAIHGAAAFRDGGRGNGIGGLSGAPHGQRRRPRRHDPGAESAVGDAVPAEPGGISHQPDESVREEDIDAALAVGKEMLRTWRAES
ncbi:MAG: hypothetical protein WDO73_20490 [Ignavibacteriota bacterium]